MTSLTLQYGRFRYSPLANIQTPTTSTFSTDLDETGIKIHGLLRSFIYNIITIRVAVPFKHVFWCSKEPSHQEGSFEYPQHMFWFRNTHSNLGAAKKG